MAVADTKSYPVEYVRLDTPADINKMIPIALRGGYNIDVNARPDGTSSTRVVEIAGNPTGGTFTLVDQTGAPTSDLAHNASPEDVQVALQTLLGAEAPAVTVSGQAGGPYIVVGDIGKLTASHQFTGGNPPQQPRISVNEYRITISRNGADPCSTTIGRYVVMDGERIYDLDAAAFHARYDPR